MPRLTPGILGLALTPSGGALALRRGRPNATSTTFWMDVLGTSENRNRAVSATALTVLYGGLLFGRLPYAVATFLFVAAFVLVFEIGLAKREARGSSLQITIIAIVLGAATSLGTQVLFETLFLIQLP